MSGHRADNTGYRRPVTELPPLTVHNPADGPWWKLRAGWLYDALVQGRMRDHDSKDDVEYNVSLESIGTLSLPAGKFVAADPYVMDAEPEPFAQRLGADRAEVIAARALVGEGHERVAALLLRAGSDPISDWAMATMPGQDVGALEAEGFFGYGVDAGTGSFGSPEAMRVTARVMHADAGMLDDSLSKALFADGVGTRSAVVLPAEDGAEPVAACSSGWGDGAYPTWLGLDADGDVTVAVTDFLLTGDPYAAPAEPAAEAPPAREKSLLRRLFGG